MTVTLTPPIRHPAPQSSTRWAVGRWADIPSKQFPGQVYLRRLRLVQTPIGGVYVHWIYGPDAERHLHDHPWTFASLIIRGGYTEWFSTDPWDVRLEPWSRLWDRGTWHLMRTGAAHRIVEVLPGTVTLILTGPRRRTWGFWVPNRVVPLTNRWVPWREYGSDDE